MRSRTTLVMAIVIALIGQTLAVAAGSASTTGQDAPSAGAVDLAVDHVRSHHDRFDLSASDVSDLIVTDVYRSNHNGLTHVYLRQRVDGIEVLGANMTVNVTNDGRILHVGSRFISGLSSATSGTRLIDGSDAVELAARDLNVALGRDATLATDPKLVYQPTGSEAVRLAWNLQIA